MVSIKQSTVLAIVPKCTGFLSLVGSTYIFADVIRNQRKRAKSVYHRLMMGLSIFDMLASAANVFSTWPIPAGTPNVFGAAGTQGTCTAQGFIAEVGNVCTPVYNAALCAYYIFIIKNGWTEAQIRGVEHWLHFVPLFFGWTMGFLGIGFTLYNPSGWLCWFAPYPATCIVDDVPCERGQYANLFRWVHYVIVWSAILFVTVGMFVIYRSVSRQEKATEHLTNHRRGSVNRGVDTGYGLRAPESAGQRKPGSKSRKVANQALLFVIAMYLTWIFTTALRLYQIKNGHSHYPLLLLMAIFFPLQGFFNSFIYLRPRYLRTRLKNPNMSLRHILWIVFLPELSDHRDMSDASMVGGRHSHTRSQSSNPLRGLSSQPSKREHRRNSSDNDSSVADYYGARKDRGGRYPATLKPSPQSSQRPPTNGETTTASWDGRGSNDNISAEPPKDDASCEGSPVLEKSPSDSTVESFRSTDREQIGDRDEGADAIRREQATIEDVANVANLLPQISDSSDEASEDAESEDGHDDAQTGLHPEPSSTPPVEPAAENHATDAQETPSDSDDCVDPELGASQLV